MDTLTLKPNLLLPNGEVLERVSYNVNGLYPALSEYIAYDTLTPPNPFIAVTQDGLGRVVYDGGFPKFYNQELPGTYTNFAQLPPQFKYLHNAINWVLNLIKTAQGNRNILVIGDAPLTQGNYKVGVAGNQDFLKVFEVLGTILSINFTLYSRPNSSTPIDFTFDQLNAYAAVVFMGTSSNADRDTQITQGFVDAMVSYRAAGNGLIFITDHGNKPTTLESAQNNSRGFFKDANRIIINFGAWFTGNFDRTPVNVGFIRQNYGDHPLYAGLGDAEFIPAAGSESAVRVSADTSTKRNAEQFGGFVITQTQTTNLRAAVSTKQGNVYLVRADVTIPTSNNGLYGTTLTVPAGYGKNIDIYSGGSLSSQTPLDLGTYTYLPESKTIIKDSGPNHTWYWSFKLDSVLPL